VRESKPNAHDMIYTPSVFVCCMLLSCMLILRIYSPSLSEANDIAGSDGCLRGAFLEGEGRPKP
jgi:hypothetical protein